MSARESRFDGPTCILVSSCAASACSGCNTGSDRYQDVCWGRRPSERVLRTPQVFSFEAPPLTEITDLETLKNSRHSYVVVRVRTTLGVRDELRTRGACLRVESIC